MDLIVTVLIEAVAALPFAHRMQLGPISLVLSLTAVNLITQPLFSATLRHILSGQDYLWWRYFLVGEALVWLVEAVALSVLWRKRAGLLCWFFLAGIANGSSLLAGLALPV